jgi:putative salt-induced outer membrane protein
MPCRRLPVFLSALLLVFLPSAHAADTVGWHGGVDAGYTATAGSSKSTTVVAGARAGKTDGNLTHHLEAGAKNSEEANQRNAESYRVAGKEDIAFSAKDYLFIHGAWDKDRFSGYDWQLSSAMGYGRKLIDAPTRHLSVEAGPGYRHDDLPLGNTEDTALLHAAANFDQQITGSTSFRQVFEADVGEDNTLTRSLSELAVKMSERLRLKAALDIKRNSEPPAGSKNTDRTTSLAVVWSY